MKLSPETVLRRVPELFIEVDSAHQVRLHHDRRVLELGHHALGVLDVFHTPTSVREAMTRLAPRLRGQRSIEELLSTIVMLANAGALTQEASASFTDLMFPTGGYGLAYLNIAILEDPIRKSAFIRAIDEVVTPDDVVLDLGTGSGILAIAAARAGARHVYAVEPARSGDLAAQVARSNGYGDDRITFVRGWSTTTELPQKATVLTTDIIGNDALDMVIWETLQDARKRLLTPDARLIPSRLDAYAYLVNIPEETLGRHRVLPQHIERWQDRFGIDFGAMLEAEEQRVAGFYERPEVVRDWQPLSEPALIYSVDLRDDARVFDGYATVEASREGLANGVVVYFSAQLGPTTTLTTAPWEGGEKSHWYSAGWAFKAPLQVRTGDQIKLGYHYAGDGRATVAPAT